MKKILLIILPILFSFPSTSYAVTYATWNPSDISLITLSGGNLVATGNTVNWGSVRATIGKSSGKWYWETTWHYSAPSTVDCFTGISNTSFSISNNNYVGIDANGWAFHCPAQKYHSNVGSSYGTSIYATNDVVIGVALDMDAGTITIYENGVNEGQMYSGLTGTLYPTVSINNNSGTGTWTANFGASAFAYTPPTGFCYGLSDTCVTPNVVAPFQLWLTSLF